MTRLLLSVVLLHSVVRFEGDQYVCSAFMTAASRFLTARHCVDRIGDRGRLVDQFGLSYPYQILKLEQMRDLAVLKATVPNKTALPLATHITVGDAVVALGYTVDGQPAVVEAHIEGVYLKDFAFVLDRPLRGGMSGGPLVTRHGEVVGVNKAILGTLEADRIRWTRGEAVALTFGR